MPKILEINVDFPYDNPYTVQLRYMEKMILAIRNSENGVFESPTGTGKTLSILCSGLACIESQQIKLSDFQRMLSSDNTNPRYEYPATDEIPWISKIIFTSRTHSQLKQAMKEFKTTRYKYMRSGILGSRKQMCINCEVKNHPEKIDFMCKSKVKRNVCSFFNKGEELKSNKSFMDNEINGKVLDIEDLVALGTEKHFCPYYMSQHLAENADIVFSPYNYVLDERIRRNETLYDIVKNGIIVIDEAHNIPQLCEDLASVDFTYDDIVTALNDVDCVSELLPQFHCVKKNFIDTDLTYLRYFIARFKTSVDEMVLLNPLCELEFDGEFIFTLMDKSDISFHNARNITRLIDDILDFLAEIHRFIECGWGLRKFSQILWVPFCDSGDEFRKNVKTHYRVYAQYRKDDQSEIVVPHVKVYNFWCFNAKFVLEKLVKQMHTRSVIFTSGTMSPLKPFIESLSIPIRVTLQNDHIVPDDQVLVEIISSGSDGERLDSSYNNRSSSKYITGLGSTILSLCPVIPDGLLIFFSSYKILNACKEHWQASGIWSQIQQKKTIFIEKHVKNEFMESMEEYYATINDPCTRGAIFIGVCRGKVAEGLDFADANGRAVIITGIPFPPFKDSKVQLKWRYMNDVRGGLSGQAWYNLEAARAVNQAVGRIIRHRNDFGAILLLDCRFNLAKHQSQLSTWIKRHFNKSNSLNNFGQVISSIARFFQRHRTVQTLTTQTYTPNRSIDVLLPTFGTELDVISEGTVEDVPISKIQYNLLFENEL